MEDDRYLLHLLLHTAKLLEAVLREELSPYGLHHGQGRVLVALVKNKGGLTQVEIARGLGMRETAATQVVRRLEELGLVSRSPDPDDTRAVRVVPTASGRRAADRVRAAWADTEARLRAGLQPEGVESARRVLEWLRRAMGGEGPTV